MSESIARSVRIHGRVQGVFFRDSMRRQARQAGVTGWVRNDPDGRVSAHLEGPEAGVDRVLDWIRGGGPPRAHVTSVDVEETAPSGHEDLRVRH